MNKIITLLLMLSLTACSGDGDSTSVTNEPKGTFSATLGDKNIETAVRCFSFDSDEFDTQFVFVSDGVSGKEDSNGDGLIIRGDNIKLATPIKVEGIALDINDNGIEYETMSTSPGNFEKNDRGLTGTASLLKAGSITDRVDITFEVVCK